MGIKEMLVARKKSFEQKKDIVKERIIKSEEIYKITRKWIEEFGILEILTIEDKEWKNEYNIPENTYIIKGLGINIWVRHIKDPKKMEIMIGDSTISFKDGKWYYRNENKDNEFNKEVFEIILIKEMSDEKEYY